MYRSPRHRVPWWVVSYLDLRSMLSLTVLAAHLDQKISSSVYGGFCCPVQVSISTVWGCSLFIHFVSAGLVCFCYATQTIFVSITILILTTFCTFGLVAVSAWFLAERYIYSKHNGLRWLSDVIHDHWAQFIKYPPIQFIRYIPRRVRGGLRRLKSQLSCGNDQFSELEDGLPFPNGVDDREMASPSPIAYRHPGISGSTDKGVAFTESPVNSLHPVNTSNRPDTPMSPTSVLQSPSRHFSFATASVAASTAAAASESPTTPATEGTIAGGPKLKGVNLFRQIAWKAVAAENNQNGSTAASPAHGMAAVRSMTVLSDPGRRRDTDESHHLKAGRISALRPSLKKLRVTDTIWDHTALVRHLQFSPNGKVLATCGWDGTARLFDVPTTAGGGVGRKNVMAVAGKSLGTVMFWGQAAWSPDGRWLLTKWMAGIQVWTEVRHLSLPELRN
jgi:WD repeat-containing protein 26